MAGDRKDYRVLPSPRQQQRRSPLGATIGLRLSQEFAVVRCSLVLVLAVLGGCAARIDATPPASEPPGSMEGEGMDTIAQGYVQLVLALGQHDDGYVDAYYGPAEWKAQVESEAPSLATIARRSVALQQQLATTSVLADDMPADSQLADGQVADSQVADSQLADRQLADSMDALRHGYLLRQLQALSARVAMLQGQVLSFDQESQALYDATAPSLPEEHFQAIVEQLDAALPGEGNVAERYQQWRIVFVIAPERLDAVFRAAVEECRRRTAEHIELPAGESFQLEYVTDKPWSGYNWYQGNYRSLIQVNTDLPIFIDRAIDLACHEGYPGHHVYNMLLEKHLVDDRGWPEFSVYALYSPQSLIAEGTANFGIEVAFPGTQRVAYEREVLFPLAGLDPSAAGEYYRIQALVDGLGYAGNEAARRYLDGAFTRAQAEDWLVRYALMEPARAAQRVRFIDTYRSYVINYNLGQDLVRRYVEAQGGTKDAPQRRWQVFGDLLSSPRLPSGLQPGDRGFPAPVFAQ